MMIDDLDVIIASSSVLCCALLCSVQSWKQFLLLCLDKIEGALN